MQMACTNRNFLILCLSSVFSVIVVSLLWNMTLYSLAWMAILMLSVTCLVGLLLAIMFLIVLSPYIARSLVISLMLSNRITASWFMTSSGMIRSYLRHQEHISSIRAAR